jgi:hypothetical protein
MGKRGLVMGPKASQATALDIMAGKNIIASTSTHNAINLL